jgi:hypothetical protein
VGDLADGSERGGVIRTAPAARRGSGTGCRRIAAEYAALGVAPKYAPEDIAAMSLALFGGFGIDRLVDPSSVSSDTLDAALTFLFESLVDTQ